MTLPGLPIPPGNLTVPCPMGILLRMDDHCIYICDDTRVLGTVSIRISLAGLQRILATYKGHASAG